MKNPRRNIFFEATSLIFIQMGCGQLTSVAPADHDHHEHTSETTTLLYHGDQWKFATSINREYFKL